MYNFKIIKKFFLDLTNNHILSKYWNLNNFDGKLKSKKYWHGTDNHQNYIKKGNKKYGCEDVLYEINEHGYRINTSSPTNKTSNIIACFGCSNTFGHALPWDETWVSVLNKKLGDNWTTINYGVCGASNDTIARLIYNYTLNNKPKIICCYFPEIFRLEYFDVNLMLNNFTLLKESNIGNVDDYNAYKRLATEENCLFNFIKNFKFIQNLCKLNNIIFYWNTWSENILNMGKEGISNNFDFDSFTGSLFDDSDVYKHQPNNFDWRSNSARDGAHFGSFVHERLANSFYKKIIKDYK
jgi:hypothetical protein